MEVERNPLIARVDLASVTVRGNYSSKEYIEAIKARIDQVALQARVDQYEKGLANENPELVVYGDD